LIVYRRFGVRLEHRRSQFLQEAEMNMFATLASVKDYRMKISYPDKGQSRQGRRRGLGWALAAFAGACIGGAVWAGPQDGLPVRNLLVEWRVNGMSQSQRQDQGVRSGQILVDSRGNIIGRTGIGLSSSQTEGSRNALQQVQVINGGRARLFVGQTQPHLVWQWAWTDSPLAGAGGGMLGVIGPTGSGVPSASADTSAGSAQARASAQPRLAAQTVWIDVGQGLYVRPRWPGGREPVMVDLEAQARQPVSGGGSYGNRIEPDGQTRRLEVGSTLSVPMGQWTVVARSGSQTVRQQSGTLSTRELDAMESEQLEIRITAP
jgi:hypothetical protein